MHRESRSDGTFSIGGIEHSTLQEVEDSVVELKAVPRDLGDAHTTPAGMAHDELEKRIPLGVFYNNAVTFS